MFREVNIWLKQCLSVKQIFCHRIYNFIKPIRIENKGCIRYSFKPSTWLCETKKCSYHI